MASIMHFRRNFAGRSPVMSTYFKNNNVINSLNMNQIQNHTRLSSSLFNIITPTSTCTRAFSTTTVTPEKKVTLTKKRSTNLYGEKKEHIVILGAGWAGYRLLKELDTKRYSISLVSPRNHFLFTPLLASAAVGASDIPSICHPIRPLAAKKRAKFYEARAMDICRDKKVVNCRTLDNIPFPLSYDKLVIATGFQANDFGIPDLDKYVFFMKETGDAQRIHDHILRQFEEASLIHILDGDATLSAEEEETIRKILTFVVVGGGPTGVEFCGELTDFLLNELTVTYPHLSKYWSVKLIDALPSLLSPFQNEELQNHAKEHLEKNQRVEVYLSEFVDSVTHGKIALKSGKEFEFSTLVWCAGIKPYPFVANFDCTKNERKTQILTDRQLKIKDNPSNDIYALGDVATIENFWLPQTAQIASQQAIYLAKCLNMGAPKEYPEFQNQDKGTLAYLGGTSALYKTPSSFPLPNLTGRLGWFTWRSAYWHMQLAHRNRAHLTFNWISNFFFGRDLNRVGAHSSPVDRSKK